MALRFLMALLVVLLSLSSQASADFGTAGFTIPPYTPSECYGNTDVGNTDAGTMIALVSDDIWAGGSVCGVVYQVQCTGATNQSPQPCKGGSVSVTVTDYCDNCTATMMLSQEAFATIADPSAGIVQISY